MAVIAGIWDWLAAGSAGLFIVSLVVGVATLTLLFLGSAIVVLERFARVRAGAATYVACAAVLALGIAAIWLQVQQPELSLRPWSEWRAAFWPVLAQTSGVTLVSLGICAAALRWLSGTTLARVSLVVLALSLAFSLASTGQTSLALAPPLAIGLAIGLLAAWRRRRGRTGGPSPLERQLHWLAGALVLGPLLSAASSQPRMEFASAGLSLAMLFGTLVVFGLLPLAVAGLIGVRRTAEWFVAARYLVAERRQVFISAITMICVGGVAVGVCLIITVLSVMNGFEKTWRDEIVGNRAHFTLHSGLGPIADYESLVELVRAAEGVTGVSPYLDAEGMVRGEDGRIFAVRVRGVDPRTIGEVTDLESDVIAGSVEALLGEDAPSNGDRAPDPGILIGNRLAAMVGGRVGESILLISPYGGAPTPLGPAPRLKRFRIVGIFQSSFFQYDEVYTYVNLPAAQDFRRSGDVVDGLEARTTDFYRSRRVAESVVADLEYPFFARDWKDYFPQFFQALKTERVMMFLLLSMVMVIAAFVIVATLIMMIMEKSSDIAILKAMGASDESVERIFAIEGALIGLAGTGLGVLGGVAITHRLEWIQQWIEWLFDIDTLPASIYQFSTLPSEVDPVQVTAVAVLAMILSLGATLLPSWQGARLDPVEGLRHE